MKEKIIKELLKSGVKVSTAEIKQGYTEPCFFIFLDGIDKNKIENIQLNNILRYSIIYYGEQKEEIAEFLNKLEVENSIIQNKDIEIREDCVLLTLEIVGLEKSDETVTTGKNLLLQNTLKKYSDKQVNFLNCNIGDIEDGVYVVLPKKIKSQTVSISHKKEIIREYEINYISLSPQLEKIKEVEEVLENLAGDLEFRKKYQYIDIEYDLNVDYNQDFFIININLKIKER